MDGDYVGYGADTGSVEDASQLRLVRVPGGLDADQLEQWLTENPGAGIPVMKLVQDEECSVSFSPDAIRAHFEARDMAEDLAGMDDAALRDMAAEILDSPFLWKMYGQMLEESLAIIRQAER